MNAIRPIFISCAIALTSINFVQAEASFITPCKSSDKECMIKSAQAAILAVTPGIPELKIEPSDPLKIAEAIGDNGELKLKFVNITITGPKNCIVTNVERDIEAKRLLFEVECPLKIVGTYVVNGKLLLIPIEGSDKFEISTEKMLISIDIELETVEGDDGEKYWHIASWKHTYDPLEKVHIDLRNLFDGNRTLSDPVITLLNGNWREVTLDIGQPIVKELLKKAIDIVASILAAVPAKQLEIE